MYYGCRRLYYAGNGSIMTVDDCIIEVDGKRYIIKAINFKEQYNESIFRIGNYVWCDNMSSFPRTIER